MRVIVPRKTLNELLKLAEDQEIIRFGLKGNQMFFQGGERKLQSNILEGKFPDFAKVLPSENTIEVTLPTDAMRNALERVSLLSSDRSRAVRIRLASGEVEFSLSSPEIGEAHEVVGCGYEGEELVVSFNARYLLDMLGVVGRSQTLGHLAH